MKQIILPQTILEFTWLFINGFLEEHGLAPRLPKRILVPHPPIQKATKKFEVLPAPSYKIRKKRFYLTKNIFVGGGYIPWKLRIQRLPGSC